MKKANVGKKHGRNGHCWGRQTQAYLPLPATYKCFSSRPVSQVAKGPRIWKSMISTAIRELFECWYISHKSSPKYMFLWPTSLILQQRGSFIKGQVFLPDNLGLGITSCCPLCWIHSLRILNDRFEAHLWRICLSVTWNECNNNYQNLTLSLTSGTVEHSEALRVLATSDYRPYLDGSSALN